MEALLNVKDAANLLAVSPWTIRAYIRQGRLRPVRLGRLVRLDQGEINKFIAEAKSGPDSAVTIQKENQK